jgi:hypothetical protein
VRIAALCDPAVKQILPELGQIKNATNEKAGRMLGWKPRSNEEVIVATAESLVRLGLPKESPKKAPVTNSSGGEGFPTAGNRDNVVECSHASRFYWIGMNSSLTIQTLRTPGGRQNADADPFSMTGEMLALPKLATQSRPPMQRPCQDFQIHRRRMRTWQRACSTMRIGGGVSGTGQTSGIAWVLS